MIVAKIALCIDSASKVSAMPSSAIPTGKFFGCNSLGRIPGGESKQFTHPYSPQTLLRQAFCAIIKY